MSANDYEIEVLAHPTPDDLAALTAVWESSVRATHGFLSEDDHQRLRPLVVEGFGAVSLAVAKDRGGRVAGFAGVAGDRLEMLFVAADHLRRGVGRALLQRVLDQGVRRLDVNEQNPQALKFYQAQGFVVVGRSPLDGQGWPFPLLHMAFDGDSVGLRP